MGYEGDAEGDEPVIVRLVDLLAGAQRDARSVDLRVDEGDWGVTDGSATEPVVGLADIVGLVRLDPTRDLAPGVPYLYRRSERPGRKVYGAD